jgi:hypothetical protein
MAIMDRMLQLMPGFGTTFASKLHAFGEVTIDIDSFDCLIQYQMVGTVEIASIFAFFGIIRIIEIVEIARITNINLEEQMDSKLNQAHYFDIYSDSMNFTKVTLFFIKLILLMQLEMLEPKHGDLPSPSLKQVASFDALDPCA